MPSAPLATLRSIPLFAVLDDRALERVAAIATDIEVPAGQVIIEREQPGAGMFVIEEGRVAVELPSRTVEFGPGDFVGELSLLVDSGTRVARVRAATDVRCLAVSRVDFQRLLEDEPRIAVPMLRALAQRLVDETLVK